MDLLNYILMLRVPMVEIYIIIGIGMVFQLLEIMMIIILIAIICIN